MVKEENIIQPDSDWIGATVIEEKPTRPSRFLFLVLCISFVVSVLAYGAVDYLALGVQVIGAAVVGLLWLWDAAVRKELRFSRSLLLLPLVGLILIGCVQLLPLRDVSALDQLLGVSNAAQSLSLDPSATRFFLVQLFVYLIYFAAALTFINDQKRLRAAAVTLIIFGAAMAVFAIIQGFGSDNKIYWSRNTPGAVPYGTYVNRHHFAALMEMILALTLGLLYARAVEKDLRTLQIFAAAIMGIGLIFTGSRGAMVSLFAIIGFLTVMSQRAAKSSEGGGKRKSSSTKRKLLSAVGGIMIVFALIGVVSFLGGENDLLRAVGLGQSGDDISNGRLHFWQTTLQVFKDNPVLGVGLDALGAAYTRYDTWNGIYRVERSHNDYLQILAETGVIGFLCLLAFLFFLFRRGLQVINSSQDVFRRGAALGALAGCFGIAVHSFFDFPLRTPANALVFLILAALATVQINYPKLHRKRNK